jgi:hypothetical protein
LRKTINNPVLIYTKPWVRTNESYLDGSIDYTIPLQDFSHKLIADASRSGDRPFVWSFYKKIALELVSETIFHYPYPYVSEKTLRPMLNHRMFIIAGPAGMLQLLKQKGFETWGDLIDESYDSISDPVQRLKQVRQALDNFLNLDIEIIKQYLQNNKDKLRHNAEHIAELKQQELAGIRKKLG